MNKKSYNTKLKEILIDIKEYQQIKDTIPNDFISALKYHKKRLNLTNNELSEKTGISYRIISKIFNNSCNPTKDEVITICIGMNLSYLLTVDLLTKCNYTLETLGIKNFIIIYILIKCSKYNLETIYNGLKEINYDDVLNLSKKSKNKNIF